MSGRPLAVVRVAAALVVAAGCGAGREAVCLSSESGEVCARGGDGSVQFSGTGLEPGSDVRIDNERLGPLTLEVGPDGSLDADGRVGVLALIAGTEFTFTVSAIDDQGAPIVGDLTAST